MSEITVIDEEVCPHCGQRYKIEYPTFAGLVPNQWHKTRCAHCGKDYEIMVSYQVKVTTRAIP